MTHLIDALHVGSPNVIGVWLLDGPEPALVDAGPSVCVPAVVAGIEAAGLALTDVAHLLLTHVHPDHAGGVGTLVRLHPGLQVHVCEAGAPHVVDPERLEAGSRALFGSDYDRFFGPIEPVPAANVHILGDRVLHLEVFPTPGHAWHHVSFLGPDGACYVGDATGALMPPGRFLYPAAAPPGIDLAAWDASLDAIESRDPTCLRLSHFGEIADAGAHVAWMRERLHAWADRIRGGATVAEFVAAADRELEEGAPGLAGPYSQLATFEHTYAGLKRYLDKHANREGGT
jgi:glyoxylase-like metal-dependent hydrolase (beta-lactamase superfamily II)